MLFIFGTILFVFVVGLIVSKGSIRNVFLAGLRFIFITFVVIASIIWMFYLYENTGNNKAQKSSYNHSAYLINQENKKVEVERKKTEAEKIKLEFLDSIKKIFHNETCYRAAYNPESLIKEIYKKYEEEFEWKDISSLELLILMNRGFAEASDNEIVIFNRYSQLLYPITPHKRNDTVRKNTVPLSVYYAGPYKVGSFDSTGYLAVVVPNQSQLDEAKKLLEYRRKLEGEELKKYNTLRKSYDKYEAEGLYKK